MHYTEGDGYYADPIAGHNVYADEDPPTRDATQLRYQEMNAVTEEICNVILASGASLNAGAETIAQMVQLRDSIDGGGSKTGAGGLIITPIPSAIWTDAGSLLYWRKFGQHLQLHGRIWGNISVSTSGALYIAIDGTLNSIFSGIASSDISSNLCLMQQGSNPKEVGLVYADGSNILTFSTLAGGLSSPLQIGAILFEFNWHGRFY